MTATLGEQLGAIELAWDHELGWVTIELAGQAWLHEARDPHTGEWIKGPAASVGEGIHRYAVPDPDRLVTSRGIKDPADHPFWKEHPVSHENVIAAYDQADEGTRAQGRAWYRQIHDLAGTYISPGDPEKGAILLSTYSPQTSWPINMMNAAESSRQGKAVGPGGGLMVTRQQQAKAQKAIDGAGIEDLMTTAKTHSFGALIARGDDSPDDPYGHVVIDTHAVNVAAGGDIRGQAMAKAPIGDARQHEYVADQYRRAAQIISEREGVLMKPHQLQAITWLVQQRANQAHDAWVAEHGEPAKQRLARGRATMTKNAWKRWIAYAEQHGVALKAGVSAPVEALSNQLLASMIELAGDGLSAQLLAMAAGPPDFPAGGLADLAYDPAEPRDPKGRWTTWFHGVTGPDPKADVKAIRREGLKASGNPGYRTLAASQEEASRWAGPHGHVVEFRIPDSKRDEYLSASAAADTSMLGPARMSGLHKDLPPSMIHKVHRVRQWITADEARGDSRPVSFAEYQRLAGLGNSWIDRAKRDASPAAGLDEHWARIKADAYAEARKPWGGATIDAHTGTALPQGADRYAISVKPKGMHTVSVPETATQDEFDAAMDRARELFRPALERQSFHLGVFHDDEHARIDMDPVAIVDSLDLVEQVGAYTRAIGGAYHFKSGDGFWPPHVAEGADMAADEDKIHFKGPGEWHSQAVELQDPEPDEEPGPDEDDAE